MSRTCDAGPRCRTVSRGAFHVGLQIIEKNSLQSVNCSCAPRTARVKEPLSEGVARKTDIGIPA